MSVCYIVGAGDFYGSFAPRDEDLVIAADGGYAALCERSMRCDLLIGDMDSLKNTPSGVEIIKHPVEKDETDMHLAYLEGRRRGYTSFEIYGGVGGRDDHTFANYCLLSYIKNDGCTARLHGKGSVAFVIKNETTRVMGTNKKSISVFAFGGEARGVSVEGLRYGLCNGVLTPSFALGVSNAFTEDEGKIEVRDGELLIIAEI